MTDFSYVNAALTRTGNDPITSYTDGTIAAQIAAENYEIVVKSELSLNPWKIASKVEILNLLDEDEEGTPPEPWLYTYQIPTDLVSLRTVKVAGEPIDYALMKDKLFCDFSGDSEVVAHYLWRVPESYWPPWFAEGIVRRMEAIFLRGIGERYAEAEARDVSAEDQFSKARTKDAQQSSPRNPVTSPLLTARRGAQPRFEGPTFG